MKATVRPAPGSILVGASVRERAHASGTCTAMKDRQKSRFERPHRGRDKYIEWPLIVAEAGRALLQTQRK